MNTATAFNSFVSNMQRVDNFKLATDALKYAVKHNSLKHTAVNESKNQEVHWRKEKYVLLDHCYTQRKNEIGTTW